jgi:hypothetical protein
MMARSDRDDHSADRIQAVLASERSEATAKLARLTQLLLKTGRLQYARAARNLHDAAQLALIEEIKASGAYKESSGTWEQFCDRFLDVGARRIDQELSLFRQYGKERFRKVKELGLTYREVVALAKGIELKLVDCDADALMIDGKAVPLDDRYRDEIRDHIRILRAQLQAKDQELAAGQQQREKLVMVHEKNQQTLQASLARAEAEIEKYKGAKAPDGIQSEPERQLWAQLSTWWSQFQAALTLFAHHRDQEQVSDAALAAFQGLLTTMRDELAETVQSIEADLQLARPTLRRVR